MVNIKVICFTFLFLYISAASNTWLQYALDYQKNLASQTPINEAVIPCAGKAYDNPSNYPAMLMTFQDLIIFQNRIKINAQLLSMTDLLNLGVRHLQLDAHYISEWSQIYMCNGRKELLDLCPTIAAAYPTVSCSMAVGLVDFDSQTGCTTSSTTWSAGILEIANWIRANPTEFVLLEINDFASTENSSLPVQNLFFNPFGNFSTGLLNVTELTIWRLANGKVWPSTSDLQALNKTVMITINGGNFTQTPLYSIDLNSNLVPPNNDANNFDSSDCNNLQPDFTFFQESDFYIKLDFLGLNVSYDGAETVGHLQGSAIQDVVNCEFSACLELLTEADMFNYVWSWQNGFVDVSCLDNQCAVAVADGWKVETCQSSYQYACQNDADENAWQLSSASSTPNCSPGYTFSAPTNPVQNKVLSALLNTQSVRINVPLTYNPNHPICTYVIVDGSFASQLQPFTLFMTFLSIALFFYLI